MRSVQLRIFNKKINKLILGVYMFWYFLYYGSAIIILPGLIFSIFANVKIKTTFNKYNKVSTLKGEGASTIAYNLLLQSGCPTNVDMVEGHLSDHYNPKTKVLSLSRTTFSSNSVASVAVAAHEAGHAVQDNEGYFLLKRHSFIIPFVNIGS
jgi:Zn-dependent membrane protease YugP